MLENLTIEQLQICNIKREFLQVMWSISSKNKYSKWYIGIILNIIHRGHLDKKKAKLALGYVEGHHIIPVSFDKSLSKDKNNVIFCTAREHFLIHLLMTKMFSNPKLAGLSKSAIRGFTMKNSSQDRNINSRSFEIIRKLCSESTIGNTYGSKTKGYICYTNGTNCKFLPAGKSPPPGYFMGSNLKGKIRITNGESQRSINNIDEIPHGWWTGSAKREKPNSNKGKKRAPRKDDHLTYLKVSESCKNLIWITDGEVNVRLNINDAIPEGWVRGRSGINFRKEACVHCGRILDIGNLRRHQSVCKEKT